MITTSCTEGRLAAEGRGDGDGGHGGGDGQMLGGQEMMASKRRGVATVGVRLKARDSGSVSSSSALHRRACHRLPHVRAADHRPSLAGRHPGLTGISTSRVGASAASTAHPPQRRKDTDKSPLLPWCGLVGLQQHPDPSSAPLPTQSRHRPVNNGKAEEYRTYFYSVLLSPCPMMKRARPSPATSLRHCRRLARGDPGTDLGTSARRRGRRDSSPTPSRCPMR
ncbi:uncharacterized protein K452DRAFT_147426 [Aplosporella prunicola CBS 121167]|uniref:Uncharacterized protein n=1 Tax=Aplosporella prunicola CBS 121167 TaxID=1176127 RepID=A0A6A6BL73_9PEZI|nr:uncharacterized protein K452DRAFT_147426 [Aplosporella prunicola CBS 121167]KAF2144786.1 hypothetical protein K452DRAFT_147426 [Aplosporella prunicola CBS 121167]